MNKLLILILILLFLLLPFLNYAQSSKTDSLQALLKKNPSPTEARVHLLVELIAHSNDSTIIAEQQEEALHISRQINNQSLEVEILHKTAEQLAEYGFITGALQQADRAIELSQALSPPKFIKSHLIKGRIYQFQLAQFDNARTMYKIGYELHPTLPVEQRSVDIIVALGNICWRKGELDEADNYFHEAVALGKEQNSDFSTAIFGLGNVKIYLGEYAAAKDYYLQAYDLMVEIDHPKLAIVLGNISSVYHQMNNHKMAVLYAQRQLELSESRDIKMGIFHSCNVLGNQYLDHNQEEKTLTYFSKALAVAYRANNPIWILRGHQLFSIYYHTVENIDSLGYHTKKAFDVIEKQKLTGFNSSELHGYRGFYFEKTGQRKKAEEYYKKSIELAERLDSNWEKELALRFSYNFYRNNQDYEKALLYFEDYIEMEREFKGEEQSQQLAEMQTKYETEKKEAENQTLLATNQLIAKQNQRYKIGAGILTGLLALLAYFLIQLRKTRNQLAAQNQQLTDLNATKDKFFGIIAHDIRSPITALDGVSEQMNYYLEKDDKTKLNRLADRIDTTAKRLTSLLDNLLNWALLQTGMIPYTPKSVDIKSIAQENMELFAPVAEAKNITLKNEISAAAPVFSDESALNTIIRNLVNNAIKFTPAGGEVSINTEEKGDKIFIKINDTGTGIAADKLEKLFSLEKQSSKGTAGEKGSGLGLMLCKELVELNKGTIQAISELGKGSSFVFSLPRE